MIVSCSHRLSLAIFLFFTQHIDVVFFSVSLPLPLSRPYILLLLWEKVKIKLILDDIHHRTFSSSSFNNKKEKKDENAFFYIEREGEKETYLD